MGGVERWALQVRNALVILGYEVDILVTGSITENSKSFKYDVEIKKITFLKLFNLVSLNRYQIFISALTKNNLFLSSLCLLYNITHISSVHITLQKQEFETKLKFYIRILMHQIILNYSSSTIAVSDGVANELKTLTKKNKNKIIKIYNPCFLLEDIYEKRYKVLDKKIKIVAAGRLCYQKGFDTLIESFKSLPEAMKRVTTLTIYGDGEAEYKKYLEKLISDESRIILAGKTDNLISVLRNYDIFILSSRYEGFGNVLVEALAADCYCISFDIAHGPKEILNNGVYGVLIKKYSIDELANTIFNVISENRYRNRTYISSDRTEYLKKYTPDYFSIEINNLINGLMDIRKN